MKAVPPREGVCAHTKCKIRSGSAERHAAIHSKHVQLGARDRYAGTVSCRLPNKVQCLSRNDRNLPLGNQRAVVGRRGREKWRGCGKG